MIIYYKYRKAHSTCVNEHHLSISGPYQRRQLVIGLQWRPTSKDDHFGYSE